MKYKYLEMSIDEINSMKPDNSRLTAISSYLYISGKGRGYVKLKCSCCCGNYADVFAVNFIKTTLSCGCARKIADLSLIGVDNFKRYSKSLMQTYHNMLSRCYNQKAKCYHNYGGRGVAVCDEWKSDINLFLKWALENGWEEGLHLDKDIKGNGLLYSPDTCSFVTSKENNNNRRGNLKFEYNGEILTAKQIAEKEEVGERMVYHRLQRGWSINDAIVPTPTYVWRKCIKEFNAIDIPQMETEEYRKKVNRIKEIIKEINAL